MQSKLLTIGDVAARLGRSVDFVRDETDAGRLRAEPRQGNGHRKYRESSVITYEGRYGRRGGSLPVQRPTPPAPRQVPVRRPPPPPPLPEDMWEEELEERGPRSPTPREQVYLNGLIVAGMREAPWDLPGDWRVKMQADLEKYITIERFPYPESELTAMPSIRLHIEGFLLEYHAAKKKEEEKASAREAATQAAQARVRELIAYGRRLLELELAKWDWREDPISEARTEVQTILDAEVKGDWTEGEVRDLVEEVLEHYGPEDDDPDDDEEEDDGDDEEGDEGTSE
jgi:hypothetical protein